MSETPGFLRNVRVPALRAPAALPATIRVDDPSPVLAAHYAAIATTRMAGLPFLNPALEVEVAQCRRLAGDWLAAVITPWSILLTLVFGGGALWRDAGQGERVRCELPVGEMAFIADVGENGLGPFLYCPLIAPAEGIESQACARAIAAEAIDACLQAAPVLIPQADRSDSEPQGLTRRTFLLGRRV